MCLDISIESGILGDMSIVEVARLAGVTHGTVSRVINGRGGVSPATAQRIREAMDQLKYQPKTPERRRGKTALMPGLRTGNVCLLLVGGPREVLQRPGVSTMVATLETELRRQGLTLLLAQAASLHDLPPCIAQRKADGLLLMGEATDRMPTAHRSLPAVWLLSSHTQTQDWADHVLPDNERVGFLAAEYLAAQGHRHVGFYNDQPEHPGFATRGAAFCAVAQQRGLACQTLVSDVGSKESLWGFGENVASAELIDRLLSSSPRMEALFVPSDEQAVRVYPLLERRSLVVGRDICVVSCDHQEAWLRQLEPQPVSIDLNFELIGRRAVEQLLWRIAHPELPPGTRILIPPQLIPPTPERL